MNMQVTVLASKRKKCCFLPGLGQRLVIYVCHMLSYTVYFLPPLEESPALHIVEGIQEENERTLRLHGPVS